MKKLSLNIYNILELIRDPLLSTFNDLCRFESHRCVLGVGGTTSDATC